jgi:hypothetical protein
LNSFFLSMKALGVKTFVNAHEGPQNTLSSSVTPL